MFAVWFSSVCEFCGEAMDFYGRRETKNFLKKKKININMCHMYN